MAVRKITKLEMLALSQPLSDLYTGLETDLLANIAEFLAAGTLDLPSSQWKLKMLAQLGALDKLNMQTIAAYAALMPDVLTDTLETAALEAIGEMEPGFAALARDGIVKQTEVPIERSMAAALQTYQKQARQSLNMVNTVMKYKARAAAQTAIKDAAELSDKQEFLDMLNKAAGKAVTGIESRQAAMRQCIREMSEKGIPAFVDKRGREWSPEAYVNMDIRTTVANVAHQAQFQRMDDYGLNLVEVSSHSGARPKCARDQGKIFNRSGESGTTTDLRGREIRYYAWSDSSYGEPDGLLGINCGHQIYPFMPGVSLQTYFPIDEEENAKEYARRQQQRELERRVRKARRECMMLETAGDKEGLKKAKAKLNTRVQTLRTYCDENGLKYKPDRTAVVDYKKSMAGFVPADKRKKIAEIQRKGLDISGGNTTLSKPKNTFIEAKSIEEAEKFALEHGIRHVDYSDLPLEMANVLNEAAMTLPEDIRPAYIGSGKSIQKVTGAKFSRKEKDYYGVHVDALQLRFGEYPNIEYDFEGGQCVGISTAYKTPDKIRKSKMDGNKKYAEKHDGHTQFFNTDGKSTPFHEMGHVYADKRGIPDGFEADAKRWYEESNCDMLKSKGEAWAEAWGAYHTKNPDLPEYIAKYIENATATPIDFSGGSGIIKKSGAISGALNPLSKRADEHAERYYAAVRKMTTDVKRISENTGYSEELIQSIKDFVFNEKHDLGDKFDYFVPDYKMAESWQRLIDGKDIKPHDLTLLKHEKMERELMASGYTQEEAHLITSKTYNYAKEAEEYYDQIEKHRKK
ncbi:MAG: phage minor capsid protein [Oscillospiraceae bacterium]|nr:phage minor capsid protein [Oscillospiraceae bacterium]